MFTVCPFTVKEAFTGPGLGLNGLNESGSGGNGAVKMYFKVGNNRTDFQLDLDAGGKEVPAGVGVS